MTERAAAVLVLLGAAWLLFAGAATVPLLDPDESRFARTSIEMTRAGDPVVPRFGGQPRLVKPPLVHWIQSALFATLGVSEWVARLPAALATLGSIGLVGWIAWRRFGPEGGVWAAAILATMPLVIAVGKLGTLDALLAVHVLAAVALDFGPPGESDPRRAAAIGGLCGLAFLVKGPVGVVLPLLILLAGRTASGREPLPSPRSLISGVAAAGLVVLPWGVAFARSIGFGRALELVRVEAFERYFAGAIHTEPAWFFLPVLLAGCFPWSVPLALGVARAWRSRRDPAARTAVQASAGLVLGVAFFSLGRDKLATYLLPLAPFAALVVAWEIGRQLEEAPAPHAVGPRLTAAGLGMGAIALGGLALVGRLDPRLREVAIAGAVAWGIGGAIAWIFARRPRRAHAAVLLASAAFLVPVVHGLYPWVGERRSARSLTVAVPGLAGEAPVVTVDMEVPSLLFYLDRVPEIVPMDRLAGRVAQDDGALYVFDEDDLPAAPPGVLERLREVGRQGKYRVFERGLTLPRAAG